MVFSQVQAVLFPALDRHARPHGFGKAVDIEYFVAEFLLQVDTEIVGKGLGSMDSGTQMEVFLGVEPHGNGRVGNVHGIAGRTAEDG